MRHNLSLNKCFEKIENPNADGTNSRKGCLWALNPAKMRKMDEEILKWNKKDPAAIKRAMIHPGITLTKYTYQNINNGTYITTFSFQYLDHTPDIKKCKEIVYYG